MIPEDKSLIGKHSYYRYIYMTEPELRNELKKWCREDLIYWLKWNDPNGIYDDKQSLQELGNILTYEEGVEIMVRQIIQNDTSSE